MLTIIKDGVIGMSESWEMPSLNVLGKEVGPKSKPFCKYMIGGGVAGYTHDNKEERIGDKDWQSKDQL